MRSLILAAAAAAAAWALCAAPAFAQTWGAGVSLGLVDDVSHRFAVDDFRSRDFSGFVDYETEPSVLVRGTFGSLRTTGANSERTVTTSGGVTEVAPRLTSRVDYGTLGVSYEFLQGDSRSGIFAGIGGYKVKPDAAPAGFEEFRDPSTTVFGWHFGVDGNFRLVSRLFGLVRLTVHGFNAGGQRKILTADAGLAYRF